MVTSLTDAAPSAAPPVEVLSRADGVELIGEFQHSGFKKPPCLARRRDGQTVQLTQLLYDVLDCIDGQRDTEAVATAVSERIGKRASADNIAYLAAEKLRPLGLLKQADGSEPVLQKSNPLLALRFRFAISNERTTRRITAPFSVLFLTPVVVVVVLGFAAMGGWLLFSEGLAQGTRELLYSPGMLLFTFALTVLSAGFHEFGHAAACRHGGATPGVMGAGVYLVWPAFYTDVTDSYRLDRGGRLRTDLGGLYFNMLFALGTFGAWVVTGYDPLLVLIPLQMFQMVHQLLPFVRLDGYYILADVTGVPDLFSRIKPTLLSLIPGRAHDERVAALKPWVRVVVAVWVLAVIPVLLASLVFAAIGFPRIVATAWDSVGRQWDGVGEAWGDGDGLAVLAGLLGSVAVVLPALSILYMLGRLVSRVARAAAERTADRPALRAGGLVAAGAALAGLAWLWWPSGEYEPIRAGERWTVQEVARTATALPTGRPGLTEQRIEELDRDAAAATDDPDGEEPATPPTTEPTTTTTDSTTTTTVDEGATQPPPSTPPVSEPPPATEAETTTTTVETTTTASTTTTTTTEATTP